MNYNRIRQAIDVDLMGRRHVTVVGGAYGLIQDMGRCGLGAVAYVDFDRVDETNPPRQDFNCTDFGEYKAKALARSLKRINPAVEIEYFIRNFCDFTPQEIDQHFGHTDLLIFATDSFPAQARGNLEALRLRKPAMWIGLYGEGQAGEVVFHMPPTTRACYRCICSSRYRAFAEQGERNDQPDPTHVPSTGSTIADLRLVDAVAEQIVIGMLTAGADNRMGRLIAQLGVRNLLQVKCDPTYRLGGADIFARYLGDHPANFSFTTIALPQEPEVDCPDCGGLGAIRE